MTFAPDIAFCALDPSVGYCREAHMELQQVNKQSNVQRQKRQTQTKHRKMMGKGLGKDWITLKDFQDIGDSTTLTDLSDFDDISGVFTMKMDVIAAG